LINHINAIHLKIKQYKCTHCTYETNDKRCYKNHVDKNHPNKENFQMHTIPIFQPTSLITPNTSPVSRVKEVEGNDQLDLLAAK